MKFQTLGLIISFLLLGCAKENTSFSKKAEQMTCPSIHGVDKLFSNDGPKFIIIGESHGMKEPPAFIEALLCHSLSQGLNTGLALEFGNELGRYETYLKSEGSDADKAIFYDDWSWKGDFTDGRSSEAMMKLIDKVRLQKLSGQKLRVTLFRPEYLKSENYADRNSYSQAFEEESAKNIFDGSQNIDKTIVLVGNFHARRGRFEFKNISYEHMAQHMPPPNTLTFNVVYRSGTSWSCRGPEPSDCKEYKIGGVVNPNSSLGQSDEFRIIYNADEDEIAPFAGVRYRKNWYDGVVYVGSATASPPANLDARIPYVAPEEDNK